MGCNKKTSIMVFGKGYMNFKVYQDQASQWCWCLQTRRDQKLAIGTQCYDSQDECLYAIALVQQSENVVIETDR